jgi:glycerol-3-phosphate dehydrogenase
LESTSQPRVYDLAVIGGGINGTGIARDAAGRGASVALFEQNDLASATSSSSTKLIHGGLRYLEHYKFRLVREALMEREVLWRLAPHIVWPMRFVLPHHRGLRPSWLLRIGLLLYDHIGGRKLLPGTRVVDLARDPAGGPLKPGFARGFEYSDCWVEDARLVVLNARDAADRGAAIRTRTRVVSAERLADRWRLTAEPKDGGPRETVEARVLVNAAGPWVGEVLSGVARANAPAAVRLVQGSHIVVRRIFDHEKAYFFQNADGRIIFAIPYERDFCLIGTTDRDYQGDPAHVQASPEEIDYLCAAASEYFREPIAREDVVWTYSGVRPLYDDGSVNASSVTRDYVFDLDAPGGAAPVLSIFGGKITTFRRLAEHALDDLARFFPGLKPAWTAGAPFPGGDMPGADFDAFLAELKRRRPFLSDLLAFRLGRAYGTRVDRLLGDAASMADMGEDFGAGLTAREVDYLVANEWARTGHDILWRRSKLGLHVPPGTAERIDDYLASGKRAAAE